MVVKKQCVAMLLAGGQGSRLGALTKRRAKPAVPYGGKYKIIDFPLSNCVNSGIDTVGVLTQYEPLELNEYIGTGSPWDLDVTTGGALVLPPYVSGQKGEWYSGTANAIYQNIPFIERYDPDYILVLSGDHIYKMDYSEMLDFHRKKGADATIAVIEVPMEEASRFGIMNTDEEGKIVEFEEKPPVPKSNTASMGIYIFNWKTIRSYLMQDNDDPHSDNDFGKNIIPAMLAAGENLYAYVFKGYWKDVGTIDSLWESNMELLDDSPQLDLHADWFKIFSRNYALPPHYVGESGKVVNSIIGDGCKIYGEVVNSVISPGVVIGRGSVVKDSIIMKETEIGKSCTVNRSILDEEVTLEDNVYIGGEQKITVVGTGVYATKGAIISEGDMIEPNRVLKQD
ncbi:glucose-1-phosphate adenylyltransferase [Bittarella massiliensis (ex Durand et al. 2017)]|uniref:glucose-1-phosphate adenylyltransferase n=1 Tax=Bittarella massiliensis (ex Durand et al. 2017) TaxID=1720313 RepID=UPI001AA1BB07|nr:glucose-1-phosphate adenylyltransferase [Bittarella massiliensis (ex Durand et al. 2017)]MBO1678624.1 glucose-1-phosphate adenylyltransferase [Bittarella massiliensis (ex Durand et al. 2017)]